MGHTSDNPWLKELVLASTKPYFNSSTVFHKQNVKYSGEQARTTKVWANGQQWPDSTTLT